MQEYNHTDYGMDGYRRVKLLRLAEVSRLLFYDYSEDAIYTCLAATAYTLDIQLFDRAFGLRYAPVSMTQFMFTAGTIHLLSVANGRSVESDTALVKGSIVVLHSMGQTWKCASQSGDVLQQLLHEWHPKSASTDAAVATGKNVQSGGIDGPSSSSAPQAIDIEQVLQKNPEVAQQLRKLGWAPPELGTVQPSPGLTTTDLETLLTAPNFTVSNQLHYSASTLIKDSDRAKHLATTADRKVGHSIRATVFRNPGWDIQRYLLDVTTLRVD